MSFSFCLQINCHYSTVFELQTGIFIWFQLLYYFNTVPGTEDKKNSKKSPSGCIVSIWEMGL